MPPRQVDVRACAGDRLRDRGERLGAVDEDVDRIPVPRRRFAGRPGRRGCVECMDLPDPREAAAVVPTDGAVEPLADDRIQAVPHRNPFTHSAAALTCDLLVTYSAGVSDDDRVFKALADATRRLLLDRLFERDGQSLAELEAGMAMTRFGVMKHLRVLEDAGLVVARRSGREKLHFLNPVPIRLIHDRWIDKYREHRVSALVELKNRLEETA